MFGGAGKIGILKLICFAWFVGILVCQPIAVMAGNVLGVPDSEYNALVTLYYNTNGYGWDNRTNWLTSNALWYGVTVENGHVTRLELNGNGLYGSIPTSLSSLIYLQVLDLGHSLISGTIPTSIGNLVNLKTLSLPGNILEGVIPYSIGNLASLQTLDLSNNYLSGDIPLSIGNLANLRNIKLAMNNLTGTIPSTIGNLRTLQTLDFYYNKLTGAIPPSLGNLMTLQTLNISSNSFIGQIPASLGNLINLQEFDASVNQLSGTIPTELGNMASLRVLRLTYNQLTGRIPSSLGNPPGLYQLYLDRNSLSGIIPGELGKLSGIQTLDLSSNQLTGALPSSMANWTNLLNLKLSNNMLSGSLPTWLANMSKLQNLELSSNQFSGQIPSEIGYLPDLYVLYLDHNNLTGSIPTSTGYLYKLQEVQLNNNQLTGAIPSTWSYLSYLRNVYLENNHLCGSIPSFFGNMARLTILSLSNNQFVGQIPSGIGNPPYIIYLYLDGNQLSGEVPLSITNMDYPRITLSYNSLTATNPTVAAYLEEKSPGWKDTQTIAPTGVSATMPIRGSARVSWTPTAYTADSGYYEVGFSSTLGGLYTYLPNNRTPNKSTSSLTATGLPTGDTYYIVVRTVTLPHAHNQSILRSSQSSWSKVEASALSKSGIDGSSVQINNCVVTAVFSDCFYVESQDRSCGIRVVAPGPAVLPSMVDIEGIIYTGDSGERYVQATSVLDAGSGAVSPLYLPNKAMGGSDWRYDAATGAGQRGIKNGYGPNNIGLLAKTFGRVTSFEPVAMPASPTWFTIEDGGGTPIKCVVPPGVTVDRSWTLAGVTGISSCQKNSNDLYSLIRIRTQDDIVPIQ